MPLNILGALVTEGTKVIPYYDKLKIIVPALAVTSILKMYFNGAVNKWDRGLHGKVIIMTVCILAHCLIVCFHLILYF